MESDPSELIRELAQTLYDKKGTNVIALDVSGSMSGLIASAKQRLWDIVNQLGRAQPRPELRIAIVSYGNPEYGQDTGYVRIDLPFTSDLDAVNQTLFGFGTNGNAASLLSDAYQPVEQSVFRAATVRERTFSRGIAFRSLAVAARMMFLKRAAQLTEPRRLPSLWWSLGGIGRTGQL